MKEGKINIRKILTFIAASHIYFIFILLFASPSLWAQDVIISQNSILPHFRNPTLAGIFDAKYRISTDLRSQYFTVSPENKFNSLNLTFDSRFNVAGNDFFNIGIAMNKETQGSGKITKSGGVINVSYSKQLTYNKYKEKSDFLIAGFQLGLGQFSSGIANYYFGIQFDKNSHQLNSNIPSGEQFSSSKLFPEFNFGLMWYRMIGHTNYYCGISAYHINQPNVSLNPNITRKYSQRLAFLIGSQHEISDNISFLPSIDINFQGSNFNMRPALFLKFSLEESNNFRFGSIFSVNKHLSGISLSDLILSTSYEFSDFGIGLSYEISLSSIKAITGLNGAFEVAGFYLFGESPKRYRLRCPTF